MGDYMSWHHEDYIGLVSSIGGLATAILAYKAILESRKISQLANELQIRSTKLDHKRFVYEDLR